MTNEEILRVVLAFLLGILLEFFRNKRYRDAFPVMLHVIADMEGKNRLFGAILSTFAKNGPLAVEESQIPTGGAIKITRSNGVVVISSVWAKKPEPCAPK